MLKNVNEIFKKLEKKLNKIGWTIDDRGCDNYFIVDSKGVGTKLHIHGDILETKGGTGEEGNMYFDIRKCYIRDESKDGWVSLIVKGTKRAVFINFYNFDMKKKR